MGHGINESYDAVAIYEHNAWHLRADVILPTEQEPKSVEVLFHRAKMAGWNLERQDIFAANGERIPGFKATVRTDYNRVLGVHGERYTFFPNEALKDFAKAIQGDAVPNSAGSLFGGKLVFMCLDLGELDVLGRKVRQYLLVVNRHDTESKLRTVVTPIEAVCANTVGMGLANASRSWSSKHTSNVVERARQASLTLQINNAYYNEYKALAERLALKKTSYAQVDLVVQNLFPFDEALKKVGEKRVEQKREAFMHALQSPDLEDFRWTGWGLVQAAADYESHFTPKGVKRGFPERRFASFIDGSTTLVDRTLSLVEAL